nr:MAG TPA: hypothetical protein [Caudoviricetes sp.]
MWKRDNSYGSRDRDFIIRPQFSKKRSAGSKYFLTPLLDYMK